MTYEQQVWNAWTAGVIIFVALVTFFVLSHRSVDNGPTLLARVVAYFVMSLGERAARRATGMKSVYIPVSSMPYHRPGMENDEGDAPDMEAENTDMPRLSRNITDSEMIVLLSAQRGKDGKHRYSANQIFTLVGGDRNTVMARVKELRAVAPPAEYMRPDGTKVQATYPVSGRRSAA